MKHHSAFICTIALLATFTIGSISPSGINTLSNLTISIWEAVSYRVAEDKLFISLLWRSRYGLACQSTDPYAHCPFTSVPLPADFYHTPSLCSLEASIRMTVYLSRDLLALCSILLLSLSLVRLGTNALGYDWFTPLFFSLQMALIALCFSLTDHGPDVSCIDTCYRPF
jgi:hypothetical protein